MRIDLRPVVVLLLTGCAHAAPLRPSVLPLKTVRLYETGVGYFERAGRLPSAATSGDARLPVPEGHLDDALKTLVVLTPGGSGGKVQIGGIEFGSRLSHGMARALAGLPQTADSAAVEVTYAELLGSMEGSLVEVRTRHGKQPLRGRLVHVEALSDDKKAPRLRVTLLGVDARALQLDEPELASVRPVDAGQAARLDGALESLLSHGQSRHALRLLGAPGSEVALGYIAEAPVWRTSYRLVIPQKGAPTLQAWALLHNDTDEDWQNVHVDLVNGRPDSFLFPLAAPRYASRALVTPQNELSTVPQLMGQTADTLWGDHVDGAEGGVVGGAVSGVGYGGGGSGAGYGLGSIGTIGHGSGVGESSLLAVGDLASVAQAQGIEAGALFVYQLPNAVELRAHASALVPFLQNTVEADRIAFIDPQVSTVARSAVRLVNSTGQTLPDGTIAFFADGGFSGEASVRRLKPHERSFISFGADLDVDAKSEPVSSSEAVERVTFTTAGDSLTEHYRRTDVATWSVENRGGQARAVYVALDLRRNSQVTGADRTDFDHEAGRALMMFALDGRSKVERAVTTVQGLARSQPLDGITSARLTELAALSTLDATDRARLTDAIGPCTELQRARQKLADAKEQEARLEKDLARLRDDAKSLGDHGASAQPLVARMVTAEDAVRTVRDQTDGLEKEVATRRDALKAALARLRSQ